MELGAVGENLEPVGEARRDGQWPQIDPGPPLLAAELPGAVRLGQLCRAEGLEGLGHAAMPRRGRETGGGAGDAGLLRTIHGPLLLSAVDGVIVAVGVARVGKETAEGVMRIDIVRIERLIVAR